MGSTTSKAAGPTAGISGARIAHRVDIQAPAEAIWALLADVEGWPRWNPLYIEASGVLRLGGALGMAVALPGMKAQRVSATVLVLEPNAHLQYRSVSFGGLLTGVRYVDIQPSPVGGCRVSNGEIMGGVLAGLIARVLGKRVGQGLQMMNEALKATAEAQR